MFTWFEGLPLFSTFDIFGSKLNPVDFGCAHHCYIGITRCLEPLAEKCKICITFWKYKGIARKYFKGNTCLNLDIHTLAAKKKRKCH